MQRSAESRWVRAKKLRSNRIESNEWRGREARESRGTSICTEEGVTRVKKQERTANKQKEIGTRPGGCAGGGVEEMGRTGEVLQWIK